MCAPSRQKITGEIFMTVCLATACVKFHNSQCVSKVNIT